ncbi:MAG: BON domain-containing protein [Gemmataceae bacterium]
MTLPSKYLLTAAASIGMSLSVFANEPLRLQVEPGRSLPTPSTVSLNQHMADQIAGQLRQSGQLRDYAIHIVYRDGVAEVSGQVTDQMQREEALRIVQGVPGVERVRDHLQLAAPIQQVQAQPPYAHPPYAQPTMPMMANPASQSLYANQGQIVEPTPLFQMASAGPQLPSPKMPPYAWPTYAPYNNYSRVAHPTAYPYEAFPFIGPFYPFPKVPLGWRSVKLEWQDGHWWLQKLPTKKDWWRVRYW